MNLLIISFSNGVIAVERHNTAESAIKAAKSHLVNYLGIRIDFADGTSAVMNEYQKSDCLKS